MKRLVTLLLITITGISHSQVPKQISVSRYILPGNPQISGLASVKNYKAQKQVWFTERDSSKVGTLTFPRTCGAASADEYAIDSVMPSKLTYAEKTITIGNNAVRPAKLIKHKPAVWFTDFNSIIQNFFRKIPGRDSIYGLEPSARNKNTGYLAAYPSYGGAITPSAPFDIQWEDPSTDVPAPLWFAAFKNNFAKDFLTGYFYSLEPKAKGTLPYEATLTEFRPGTDAGFTAAIKVENGFVWSLHVNLLIDTMELTMMPVTGGGGFAWTLNDTSLQAEDFLYTFFCQVQPLYSTAKEKPNILPNQVWVNLLQKGFILKLNPSLSPSAIDTLCTLAKDTIAITSGLFSDNVSKAFAGKWMHAVESVFDTLTDSAYTQLTFKKSNASIPIQRKSLQFVSTAVTVNGIVRPVIRTTKSLEYSCETPAVNSGTQKGCLVTPYGIPGAVLFGTSGQELDLTMNTVVGMSDAGKFDLVVNQAGGYPESYTSPLTAAAIVRFTGKYGRSSAGADPAGDPEFTNTDEHSAEASEFALDNAYPNPFNPVTNIQFSLPMQSAVTLKIYNVLGQETATLLNGVSMPAGTQIIPFDASGFPSGVYFYRMTAQSIPSTKNGNVRTFTSMKKVVLVK